MIILSVITRENKCLLDNCAYAFASQGTMEYNSVVLVRKRTERPPLVGEIGANFCG
jgi:hypothetical protein